MNEKSTEPLFYIQVSDTYDGVVEPQSAEIDFVTVTPDKLERMGRTVRMAAEKILDSLKQSSVKPQAVALELGLNLSGEAGVPFVTKGSIKSNFKISITWAPERDIRSSV